MNFIVLQLLVRIIFCVYFPTLLYGLTIRLNSTTLIGIIDKLPRLCHNYYRIKRWSKSTLRGVEVLTLAEHIRSSIPAFLGAFHFSLHLRNTSSFRVRQFCRHYFRIVSQNFTAFTGIKGFIQNSKLVSPVLHQRTSQLQSVFMLAV